MRRHFLFAEEEQENGVGDGRSNLLRLWLDRRAQIMQQEQVARYIVFFWDLAKVKSQAALSASRYNEFFARVAKALVQSVNTDGAPVVAARDWVYDAEAREAMTLELFREAIMQVAELVLPLESEQSMYVSFFLELRESIAMVDGQITGLMASDSDPASIEPAPIDLTLRASLSSPQLYEAVSYVLRPLKDVTKIRGAFAQKMPPSYDQLKSISGLAPPNSQQMSLKQLLLCYNPRKFALSRKFSALFSGNGAHTNKHSEDFNEATDPRLQTNLSDTESGCNATLVAASAPSSSRIRNKESEDDWDAEVAMIESLEEFPAFRVAVVGPPHAGKTRVSKMLAKRLQLRYFSIGTAIEEAMKRKTARDVVRAAALANAVKSEETVSEDEANSPPSGESESTEGEQERGAADSTELAPEPPAGIEVSSTPESIHEEDVLFSNDDRDTLYSGNTLPRSKCLEIFAYYVKNSLLEGVGVVMDDIHPAEIEVEIGTDYLVVLSASRDDIREQMQHFTIAPSTRCVYSARERAILEGDPASIEARGFADFVRRQQQSVDDDTEISSKKKATETDTDGPESQEADEDSPSDGGQASEDAIDPDGDQEKPVLPLEPTQIERNRIDPPGEPTLPIRSLLLESFRERYKDYSSRVQARLAALAIDPPNNPKQRYHLIHVLASQSLSVILEHCVQAITGNALAISRTNVSRRAVQVALPEELAALATSEPIDRADQIRWLLHGDLSGLVESREASDAASNEERFSRLPSRNGKRRLSKWKEFCPVTSTRESGLVLGDPSFAAVFSGRMYLAATREALDAFCAHPLQYLRKHPQAKPYSRMWLVSSVSLASYLPAIEDCCALKAFDAVDILTKRTPISAQMELMAGKVLPGIQAVELLADAIRHQEAASSGGRWIISNLSFTSENVTALKERECLPEVIVFADPSQDLLEREGKKTGLGSIVNLKHQQHEASVAATAEIIRAMGIVVRTCTLFEDTAETVETLRRQLDPLAPRVDRVEDGYLALEDAATVFALPATPDGEDAIKSQAEKGETNHYCPVSWTEKRTLVPGTPEFVAAFGMKYYSFAGKREQDAFERNPTKYIPTTHGATSSLIPTIVLLGVRGAGLTKLTRCLQASSSNSSNACYSVLDVSLEQISRSLAKRLRTESLKTEENQRPSADLYVEELKRELHDTMDKCRDIVNDGSNPISAGCLVLAGLGDEDSQLPSPELLQVCFQQDVFPMAVIPTAMTDEEALRVQLSQWRASLPPRRKKLSRTRTVGGEEGGSQSAEGEEEPDFNLEEAEADETQRLQEQYETDREALAAAIDAFKARGVAVAPPIDVSGSFRQSVRKVSAAIDSFMARKDSLFDRCDLLDRETVLQALASGELIVGKHGTACPVAGTSTNLLESAVVYRDRVYFPHSQDAAAAFTSNPSRYLRQSSCAPPCQPTCCISGSPFVGKTRFANELATKSNLVYVSPQSAMDWVLQCHGDTSVCRGIRAAQAAGTSPDAKTVDEAISARLQSSECQLHGWVVDDYFLRPEDLQRYKSNPSLINPGLLFILDGNFQAIWERKKQVMLNNTATRLDKTDRDAGAPEQIASVELGAARDQLVLEFSVWQKQRLDLLGFWSMQYGSPHVRQIDATQTSFWNVLAQGNERLEEHVRKMRAYRSDLIAGRPARVDGVARSIDTLRARWHPVFRTFCPVELSSSRYNTSWATDRQFCVEYEGNHYWMASAQNLQQFLDHPREFIDSSQEEDALQLIAKAPVDASLLSLISVADCEFPELKGYCPVTFKLGTGAKDWAAIVKGQVFYRASYVHRVYFFASEEMRRRFLVEPAVYANQRLPVKLPPQLSAALTRNYPGKLEQELSAVLNESLLVLGTERPKFLQASLGASACFYLALILKTRAKNLPEHIKAKFQVKKEAFELDCRLSEMLKAAITPSNASCGTAIKGVRAVRGATTTAAASSSAVAAPPDLDIQELCQRFDKITGSAGSPSTATADSAALKPSFLEYATL